MDRNEELKARAGKVLLGNYKQAPLAMVRGSGCELFDAEGRPRWMSPLPWVYRTVFAPLASDPRLGSLLYALAHLAVYAGVAWWLDRQRLYLRA